MRFKQRRNITFRLPIKFVECGETRPYISVCNSQSLTSSLSLPLFNSHFLTPHSLTLLRNSHPAAPAGSFQPAATIHPSISDTETLAGDSHITTTPPQLPSSGSYCTAPTLRHSQGDSHITTPPPQIPFWNCSTATPPPQLPCHNLS